MYLSVDKIAKINEVVDRPYDFYWNIAFKHW